MGVVAQCRPEGVDDLLWPVGAWSTACEYRGEQGAQYQVEHALDVEVGANLASLDACLDRVTDDLAAGEDLAVFPGPGELLRAVMDRFPGLGPAMNSASGVSKTMQTVAEYRERAVRLAEAD